MKESQKINEIAVGDLYLFLKKDISNFLTFMGERGLIKSSEETYERKETPIEHCYGPYSSRKEIIVEGTIYKALVFYEDAWWNEKEISNAGGRMFLYKGGETIGSVNGFSNSGTDKVKKLNFYIANKELGNKMAEYFIKLAEEKIL